MTRRCCLVLSAALLCGCGGSDEPLGPVAPEVRWPTLSCDPLVPEVCGYPYPSNVFTRPDPESATGLRVALSTQTFPESFNGKRTDPTPFNRSDGFSAGINLLAYFPSVTLEGAATSDDIDRSLQDDSPTVILEADSGERVPHFVEIDRSRDNDDQRALMIRPVVRLKDATRYIVAIRNMQGATVSPAFVALRDHTRIEDPSVDPRRGLYADIFQRLEQAGVARGELQLAWDFTTATRENNTAWMLHMRDEAFDAVGADGPAFTIDTVETDWQTAHVAYRIFGHMEAPLYLDQPDPGSSLLFGDDGMPEPNPERPSYQVPFEIIIPNSASAATPAGLMQYGHGLFGNKEQIESGHFLSFIDEQNLIIFGLDLDGMSSVDGAYAGAVLISGELHDIAHMYDRLHQGMLNYLLAMRMMMTSFAADPTYGELIDGDRRYYHGISQGGIMGGVYMALTTDVTRGALGVMGQSYNLLLNRSVDFDAFFGLLGTALHDARHQQLALANVALLWDRLEPSGYTDSLAGDPLPGVGDKQVFMRAAIGDHQVPTLGAHVMARAMGAKHVDTGLRDIWGLEKVASTSGHGYVEYDFGLPPVPACNQPMRACGDPHGELRKLDEARAQLAHFFDTGEIVSFCDGPCSFPELSGCDGEPVEDPCGG